MHIRFRHGDADGLIRVEVGTTDPARFLSSQGSRGLTWCRATVEHPAEGYAARFGWIQLVKSDDNASGGSEYEMDPLEILGPVEHPFCYYGVLPTLFDAPGRDDRRDLDWQCHSFLTRIARGATPDDPGTVEAMAGFSWGFVIRDRAVTRTAPTPLSSQDWDRHLGILRREHPVWAFAPGFVAR